MTSQQLKLITALIRLWEEHEGERFMQLLVNHTRLWSPVYEGGNDLIGIKDPFYYEDKDILKDLKEANDEKRVEKIR